MRIFEGGDELMYGMGDVFMGGQTRENVLRSGGAVGTLGSGGAGRPECWVMAGIFGMDGCTGSANCIIFSN